MKRVAQYENVRGLALDVCFENLPQITRRALGWVLVGVGIEQRRPAECGVRRPVRRLTSYCSVFTAVPTNCPVQVQQHWTIPGRDVGGLKRLCLPRVTAKAQIRL